jgi:SAM-dependent methyltransferase
MEGVTRYCGVDSSSRFLARARKSGLPRSRFEFIEADLSTAGWMKSPAVLARPFEAVVCFAVLFHIPGARRRLRLLREMNDLLVDGGRAVVGVWQFLHLQKFRERIVPWEEVGLSPADVDAGDLLLDWRRGGRGLRYVHHFDPDELARSCQQAGFTVLQSFRDDGKTRDMSLYLILQRV